MNVSQHSEDGEHVSKHSKDKQHVGEQLENSVHASEEEGQRDKDDKEHAIDLPMEDDHPAIVKTAGVPEHASEQEEVGQDARGQVEGMQHDERAGGTSDQSSEDGEDLVSGGRTSEGKPAVPEFTQQKESSAKVFFRHR